MTEKRKRRHVFLWTFTVVQLVFLAWLIGGLVSASQGTHCGADQACQAGSDLGVTLGASFIIALWAAVDIIMGVSYGVYRLATRRN